MAETEMDLEVVTGAMEEIVAGRHAQEGEVRPIIE